MALTRIRFIAFAAAAAFAASSHASAFTTSGAGGRLIAAGSSRPIAIATTDGGAIVAGLNDSSQTFFLNRYGAGGESLWDQGFAFPGADGVQLASDGSGGAIIAEHQPGLQTLTLERILASGASTWQRTLPAGELVGAGDGGAWVVSQYAGIAADSVNTDGTPGAHVVLGVGSAPAAVGDGHGGAFVSWRSGSLTQGVGLYVQHVDPTGAVWPVVSQVAGSSDAGFDPLLAADALGGVVIAWHAAGELWLVRLDPAGVITYGPVLFQQRGATLAALATDATSVYVVWAAADAEPKLLFPSQELVVTRLDAGGLALHNVSLGSVTGGVLELHAAADPAGGVVVGWQSSQIGPSVETDLHIQRVTAGGARSYTDDRLATSFGPESFGDVLVAPTGEAVAIFSQSVCLRVDMQGLAMQRIAPDGTRMLAPSVACP